jgi:hypothetical protein
MSKLSIFYAIVAAGILALYALPTALGKELFVGPPKEKTTQEARAKGYRGGHFIFIYHSSGGMRGK